MPTKVTTAMNERFSHAFPAAVLAGYCILLLKSSAACADPPRPLTTAKQVAEHIGQVAIVELTVVEVKHPERRKAIFISSSPNFRSEQALAAMIRDEDLARFESKDRDQFAKRYIGHRVSVEGEVSRDEGQLIVRVTAPDKIRIVDAAAPVTKASDELVLINEQGIQRRLTAEELSKLPREECEVERGGKRQKYSGVSLASVLEHSDIVLGENSRGRFLSRYILVGASDGYQVLLSIAEADPHLSRQTVLLANQCDDRPLDKIEGPWRLLVKDDRTQRRWVRGVTIIAVKSAEGLGAPGQKK
jgi:hypothetical protein